MSQCKKQVLALQRFVGERVTSFGLKPSDNATSSANHAPKCRRGGGGVARNEHSVGGVRSIDLVPNSAAVSPLGCIDDTVLSVDDGNIIDGSAR